MSKITSLFRLMTILFILTGSVCIFPSPTYSQVVVSSGTTLKVSSGTVFISNQDFIISNGGNLNVEGSLVLKQNLTNQNPTGDLGIGTAEFSGIVPQTISGSNSIGNITINNGMGIDLAGNTGINSGLNLYNGHIRLGSLHLTLGSAAMINGTPSATNMIIATGSGELRKSFAGAGSFLFPVGDNIGTAEYTPVTLIFTGGSFSPGNYAGVKLSNTTYAGLSGNYLNRYWTISQSGIASAVYNALFQYVSADVNGTESNIRGTLVYPLPSIVFDPANAILHQFTANGATSFGIFSGLGLYGQSIALTLGWNIFSSNVVPTNANMKDIFQPMITAGKLIKVMDESGKTIENSGIFGGWQNKIGNLLQTEGYKVNVNANSTLLLEGSPVPLPLDIPLSTGWNIISYPSTILQDAKSLVQPLIDAGKLVKVMDESGKTIENFGIFGGWRNGIGNFTPNKGYKVNVLSACSLTIPASGTKSAVFVPEVLSSAHFVKIFEGNGIDHMNISLVDLKSSGLKVGDQIGILDGQNCVGAATIGTDQLLDGTISITSSSNDGNGEDTNGFISGHPIVIQLYRSNQLYNLDFAKVSGSELFEKNGSLLAKVSASDLSDKQIQEGSDQFYCYPNPFVNELTVYIQNTETSDVLVTIYNLNGQEIRQLYKGTNTGELSLKWNGTNSSGHRVAPGLYLIKMNGESRKVMFKGGR